jgi:hypothetical protein
MMNGQKVNINNRTSNDMEMMPDIRAIKMAGMCLAR